MSVVSSKILYTCIIIIVLGLASGVEKSRKHSSRYAITIVIILALIAGLRGWSVGIDTLVYKNLFELNNGQVLFAFGVSEPIFIYASSAIMTFTGSVWTVFLFWAIVTNGLIVSRLYQLRERLSFPTAIAIYTLTYYFPSINIMRQMVAVAVVFYGTKWLEGRQRIWKYIVLMVIAVLIHYSALICFVFIPVSLICKGNFLSKTKKILLLLMILSYPIAIYVAYTFAVARYAVFLTPGHSEAGIGMLIPIKLAIFLFVFIWEHDKRVVVSSSDADYSAEYKMDQFIYLIGLLGFLISYFWRYADRMVYYFSIFETICYSIWMKKHCRNDFIKCLVLLVMAAYFLTSVILAGEGSGQGQYPYTFFWMD